MKNWLIDEIFIENFRNYGSFRLNIPPSNLVWITGFNGVGKTNLLEAISLVFPGSGLRKAAKEDLPKVTAQPWSIFVSGNLENKRVSLAVKNFRSKSFFYNKEKIIKASAFPDLKILTWTPVYDTILGESLNSLRSFFDDIVTIFFPEHTKNLKDYHGLLRQRTKALELNMNWDILDLYESQIVDIANFIEVNRQKTLNKIETILDQTEFPWPKPQFRFEGSDLSKLQSLLKESRKLDLIKGGASFGSHKSNLKWIFKNKNVRGDVASSGEQKLLLISLILGVSYLITEPHILLLDEILVHLDSNFQSSVLGELAKLQQQVWLTANYKKYALGFEIKL